MWRERASTIGSRRARSIASLANSLGAASSAVSSSRPSGRVTRTQARCCADSGGAPAEPAVSSATTRVQVASRSESWSDIPDLPPSSPAPRSSGSAHVTPVDARRSTELSTTVHDARACGVAAPPGPRGSPCRGPSVSTPCDVGVVGEPDHTERATGPTIPARRVSRKRDANKVPCRATTSPTEPVARLRQDDSIIMAGRRRGPRWGVGAGVGYAGHDRIRVCRAQDTFLVLLGMRPAHPRSPTDRG